MFTVGQRVFDTYRGFGTVDKISERNDIVVLFDEDENTTLYDFIGREYRLPGNVKTQYTNLLTVEQARLLGYENTSPPALIDAILSAKKEYIARTNKIPQTILVGNDTYRILQREARRLCLVKADAGIRDIEGTTTVCLSPAYLNVGFAFVEEI